MAEDLTTKLDDLLADKYNGGMFKGEDIEARERTYADEHVAASDGIEKFFGLASYLAKSNPNQSAVNRECQLMVMEVKYGTHLLELIRQDPVRAHNIMLLCRKFANKYKALIDLRSRSTMEQRVRHLQEVLKTSKEKADAAAGKLRELQQLSEAYRFPNSAELAAAHKQKLLAMTAGARKTYLSQHFDMFRLVHHLNEEAALRSVWHLTEKKTIGLWRQAGLEVAQEELVSRYLRVGSYAFDQGLVAGQIRVSRRRRG
eukprot:SAG31_NODE_98_length_25640_cov_9.936744_3_plen_258_part_00